MTQADTDEQLDHDLYCTSCGQRLGYSATDKLTGLLVRWGWDLRAEEALAKAAGRASTLLLADLDGFKTINDTYGHLAGDAVLQAAASVLTDTLRITDVVGRYGGYGGDEFLVLLPARDRQLGEMIARRIRARIRRAIIPIRSATGEPVLISGVASSIGIAVTDPTTARVLSLSELLRQADAALLQAKNNGGNQIVVAGGGAVTAHHLLATSARSALKAAFAPATPAGGHDPGPKPEPAGDPSLSGGQRLVVRSEHPRRASIT